MDLAHEPPMDLPCVTHRLRVLTHGSPMGLPWALNDVAHGFSIGLPWVSHGSPVGLHGASVGLPWVSRGSPVDTDEMPLKDAPKYPYKIPTSCIVDRKE